MADAKSENGAPEPSMEEILQSIKKIISEDDTSAKQGSASSDAAASDVLELTDAIEPPASPEPVSAAQAFAAAATAESAQPAASSSHDVLSKIDEAIAVEKPLAQPVASATPPAGLSQGLISEQAASVASSAFKRLQEAAESPIPNFQATPSPTFISGASVEAMVMEMLRPMMKDWLDKNLPGIVERIVTIEIRKLTK
jgi:cell pole-organizing protein PopZ